MRVAKHATLLGLLAGGLLLSRPVAAQDSGDVVSIITSAAERYGVSAQRLIAVGRCESRLDPFAVGDSGNSVGLFQINAHGLRPLFFQWGYDDLWSAWQQADFTARAFQAGLASHWSCAR